MDETKVSTEGATPPTPLIVVPCYNEAARWQSEYWRELLDSDEISLLFVDDGSTDETWEAIVATCSTPNGASLRLKRNVGKGEALRHGMLRGIETEPSIVGFLDADAAFPAQEVLRLSAMSAALLEGNSPRYDALWSSRVMLAGRDIKRLATRHYVGRIVATVVAPMHGYEVYDTQSGFKLFRSDERLHQCLSQPFATRWFSDVEMLQRWTRAGYGHMRIWEEPVTGWHDVGGSKMSRSQYGQLLRDLRGVYRGRVRR